MDAFLTSIVTVFIAEMGDKTQLLSILLVAKFRKPVPIIGGVLAATLLNHAVAAAFGDWLAAYGSPEWMRIIVGVAFLGAAVWALIPDKMDEAHAHIGAKGAFIASFIAFFLAENADKTQLATVMLAATYHNYTAVLAGTTFGMLLANIPAILLGERLISKLPLKAIRIVAAVMFALLGVYTLV